MVVENSSAMQRLADVDIFRVPPNVKFVIDDVEAEWVTQEPFDFIFCRYMVACIKDWPALMKRVHEYIHRDLGIMSSTNRIVATSCPGAGPNFRISIALITPTMGPTQAPAAKRGSTW